MANPTEPTPSAGEPAAIPTYLPTPLEETAGVVVAISYMLQNLFTAKRPDKASMAVDLGILTENLKTRFPRAFPPVVHKPE